MSIALRTCSRRRRDRSGFGTFIAIAVLLIIAVILPLLASVFTAEAKRTRAQAQEAQLRQLLTAGAAYAAAATKGQATSGAGGEAGTGATTRPVEVPLPPELADAGASVTCSFTRVETDHAKAVVRAKLGERSMEQTIRLERLDGAWRVVSATLNQE